jgi:L-threonylcarbamoyladenylate synthase
MKIKALHLEQDTGIQQAGQILKNGGLVAFPTETVYGLGGNALDVSASQKIYAAKGRPSDNPLIVHIADLESLSSIVLDIPKKALDLAKVYWPGPLTMIFTKSDLIPREITGGLDSVAVRMPNHPIARALIRAAGGYVAAPSANTSGRPSPTSAAHVMEDMGETIDLIIDGGDVDIGLESTIVDFTEEVPVILRPGYLSADMLKTVLKEVRMDSGLLSSTDAAPPKAPGMKYRHYAPQATLVIVDGDSPKVTRAINEKISGHMEREETVGVLCTDETLSSYESGCVKSLGRRCDEESIAQHLYGALREFDREGISYIYSETFYTPVLGQAIMNRLLKAAGYQIIKV